VPLMIDWPTIIAIGIVSAAVFIAWRVFDRGSDANSDECESERKH
jgi:hypothetical protein